MHHPLAVRPAADVKKICYPAAVVLDEVERCHREAGTVPDNPYSPVKFHERKAVFLGLPLPPGQVPVDRNALAGEAVVIYDQFGIGRIDPGRCRDQRVDLGKERVLVAENMYSRLTVFWISDGASPDSSRRRNPGTSGRRGQKLTERTAPFFSCAVSSMSTPPVSAKRITGCFLARSIVILT